MTEKKLIIKIYCSAFVSLSGDWDALNLSKYGHSGLELIWVKNLNEAEVVIVPSHVNKKSVKAFQTYLKEIPSSATLLIYPNPVSSLANLEDITQGQLEHPLWPFPSSVLLPEEIINEMKKKMGGQHGL